ncbi:hypothetical protein HQ571_01380 [Candidatus Kuenenbacteria bacterium]|nr:hypothetical protein [Candidatus Kuenenbacteria bacterium]
MIMGIVATVMLSILSLWIALRFDLEKVPVQTWSDLFVIFSAVLFTPYMFFEWCLFSKEEDKEWHKNHLQYLLLVVINLLLLGIIGRYVFDALNLYIVPMVCFIVYASGFAYKRMRQS